MNLRAVPICLWKGRSLARMTNSLLERLESEMHPGTSPVVQLLRLHSPNAGDPGSIPGQGTRCHMPQLSIHMPQIKVLHATTKTWPSQQNKTTPKTQKPQKNQKHSTKTLLKKRCPQTIAMDTIVFHLLLVDTCGRPEHYICTAHSPPPRAGTKPFWLLDIFDHMPPWANKTPNTEFLVWTRPHHDTFRDKQHAKWIR